MVAMIHRTASIEDGAEVPEDVEIGAYTLINSNVEIGSGTVIGSHCVIGEQTPLAKGRKLVIGPNSRIRSHCVLYEGSTFGPGLETGHHVTIRERTKAGTNLRVGTLSDVQGDVEIGDYVRIHSNVHVGKRARIGDFVWIYPYVVLTNDPTPPSDESHHQGVVVESFAVITVMCAISPGVTIGSGAMVAAMSMVTRDVEPETAVRGAPAKLIGGVAEIPLRDGSGNPAYPWTRHFRRGYPEEVIGQWGMTNE